MQISLVNELSSLQILTLQVPVYANKLSLILFYFK